MAEFGEDEKASGAMSDAKRRALVELLVVEFRRALAEPRAGRSAGQAGIEGAVGEDSEGHGGDPLDFAAIGQN